MVELVDRRPFAHLSRAGHEGEPPDAFRPRVRGGECVRSATGVPEEHELVDPERVQRAEQLVRILRDNR